MNKKKKNLIIERKFESKKEINMKNKKFESKKENFNCNEGKFWSKTARNIESKLIKLTQKKEQVIVIIVIINN